jgi:hypothetical protein
MVNQVVKIVMPSHKVEFLPFCDHPQEDEEVKQMSSEQKFKSWLHYLKNDVT